MKEKILKLREEGKTYREIREILGCAKATISYHCGNGQKQKSKERKKKQEVNVKYKIYKKIDFFVGEFPDHMFKYQKRTPEHEDYYKKIIENPYCYLTGKRIDLNDSRSYHLDHIIPRSKGGDNSIKNMGLALKEANQAKSDMTKEEFLELCKSVIKYNE